MKVLMLFYDLTGAAGIQRVIATLASALVRAGTEVHVVTTSPDPGSFFPLDPRVVRATLQAPEPVHASRLAGWAAKARWALGMRSALARYVARNGITHVVDHGTALGLLHPSRRLGGAAFVLCRHFPVAGFPGGRALHRLLRPLKRHAHVVVLTEGIRAELAALGYRNLRVIPNPLAPPSPRVAPPSPGRLLAVGRDSPQKGFDLLLPAFAALLPRHPEATLRIVGPGISRSPTLVPLRARLGLDARVALSEPVADLAALIDEAAAVVLPSRYEALPMVLLEALSRGAAVVGTAVDGIRDYVEDGANGVLVAPGSPQALARGLGRVLEDPDLRGRVAANGPASVAHLSPDRVVETWRRYLGAIA